MPVMGTFFSGRAHAAAYFAACLIVFESTTYGSADELRAPDPFSAASSRLKGLSSFVDDHLQTVKTVNRAASTKIAASKNQTMDVSAFSQIAGKGVTANTRTIENTLRLQQLDSAPNN